MAGGQDRTDDRESGGRSGANFSRSSYLGPWHQTRLGSRHLSAGNSSVPPALRAVVEPLLIQCASSRVHGLERNAPLFVFYFRMNAGAVIMAPATFKIRYPSPFLDRHHDQLPR
jgi:hypothetical protein